MIIATFNLHNFFLFPPLPAGEQLKSEKKVKTLASMIEKVDPDILLLQEVGGAKSLEYFASHYLQDRYSAFSLPGNSDRGIDLGFLVRHGLSADLQVISHRDHPLNAAPLGKLSRDILELRLVDQHGKPFLVVLNTHLKSQRVVEGGPDAKLQRSFELKACLEIYQQLKPLGIPVVLGGDFNSIDVPSELQKLGDNELFDIMTLKGRQNAWTHVYFDRSKKRHLLQFDYLILDKCWHDLVDVSNSGIYSDFFAVNLPQQPHQLYQSQSDHYPLILKLKFPGLANS